ncbi:family 78 glycoside hydrolase catalytic domain [Tengunoibacter tsumagoiensis]|uniref:Uncharacterized protein n=1 Tax=Tengunoibacter tsumagoiensis TaxID=2014871 RepID=A0A402A836_9CHLR|nr:family 78 glycoside hydrolase catalytic domain [Tengunoibacter tsumagoiensis]GCE15141.1 hypothetical protein KTT_50000 [Tengunoibacter tsumagoiensis]
MQFQAHWIWKRGEAIPRNVVMQFRQTFHLTQPLPSMSLHISADSRYILFLNGVRLGYGPARAFHEHYEYDTYDVSPHLAEGINVIAVMVQHWGEGTFLQRVGRAGLLVQLDNQLTHETVVATTEDWRVKRAYSYRQDTVRIACQLPWEEQFDARLEEKGWTTTLFDDTTWEHAVELGPVGMQPWGDLLARTIPFLSDEPVSPVRITAAGLWRRPEVVAAIHLLPYIAPGDLTVKKQYIDIVLATILQMPEKGEVTVKICSPYGQGPQLIIDGQVSEWQPSSSDREVECQLAQGDHVLLLNWQGEGHDLDITITVSGQEGMSVRPLLENSESCWYIAVTPWESRAAILHATTIDELLASGGTWQVVSALNAPTVDVYMDITSSRVVIEQHSQVSLPIDVPATEPQLAQHYLIDFGREVIGWITFELEAPAGAIIDLVGIEGIQKGQLQWTEYMNNSLRYTCRDGLQTYTSTTRRGFRYLVIAVHSATAPVRLNTLLTSLSTYPGRQRGSFRCSDVRLTQIWEMCAYTLRMCTEDTFTDCPAYEQTLWTGDAYIDTMVHAVVHGDPRIVKRNLKLVADSLRYLPVVNSQVPSDWEEDLIPNWSWLWTLGCLEYYHYTGDLQTIQELYPALVQQADFILQARNTFGLFEMRGVWHLLDWAPLDDREPNIIAHENIFAVAALRATAALARIVNDMSAVERYEQGADQMQSAINNVFWSEQEQAYVDSLHGDGELSTTISQPTNISALFVEVATKQRASVLMPAVVKKPDHWVRTGSPWMLSFNLQVLAREKKSSEMLTMIRNYWGDMLDKGATTTWEAFAGWMPNGRWSRSWCHAWSTMPAYVLSSVVLGIRPLEAGFAHSLIAPQLCGMSWAQGSMPTPHGEIDVWIEAEAGSLMLQVHLPSEISAEVRLPVHKKSNPGVIGSIARITQVDNEWRIALPQGSRVTIEV